MDLDRLQFGASIDQLQEDKGGGMVGQMNHSRLWVKSAYFGPGADDMDLHGGWHTPQGTYPAALASLELENQISFSGRIFFAHRQEG